jgi:phosphopantetheine binding protein
MDNSIAVAPDGRTASAGPQDEVLGIVREVLGRADMGPDDDVFDHGATSLSFVRILARINQRCGVMVHAAALGGLATARNMAAQVAGAPAGPGA